MKCCSACLYAELNPVTLQLDLDGLFQLDNLVLDFKVRVSPP